MINCFSLKSTRGWQESLGLGAQKDDGKQHIRVEMAGTDQPNTKKKKNMSVFVKNKCCITSNSDMK